MRPHGAPLGLPAGGLLARVTRGPLVESVHTGHLVVVRPGGEVRLSVGEPDAVVWGRSCLKPLQAVGLVEAGLDLDPRGLALASASHSGEPAHLAVVRDVLADHGLTEADLASTPDVPLGAEAADAWRAAGGGPTSLTQNCSGKHAAMLATCVRAGWPTAGYLDPGHPVQRAAVAAVERLTGVPAEHAAVDGCGAALPSTTLRGLARAFGRLAAAPAGTPEARVADAVRAHPALVGGTGRDVTDLLRAVPGLVAKDGAEGVYAAGLPDGTGIAVKVADGAARPRAAVVAAALTHVLTADGGPGAVPAALGDVGRVVVLGHGTPVGELVVATEGWT